MIPNKTPASEYRVRTLDRNDLNDKGKIYIGEGETTAVDGVTGVSKVTAQNIIDAINDNATNKTITAGGFTATGAIQSATLSCQGNIISENGEIIAASFKGNADSATNAANATYATSATNATNATYAIYAQYASTDRAKGTIEERLTNLGFKSGSATIKSGSASPNNLYRQGNYVYGRIGITGATLALNATWFTLPENFRPKT